MGITVETSNKIEPPVHVVTSILRFSEIKRINANNYTCTASNLAGSDSKTANIIVEFRPNFDNTPYNVTYGWLNHNTEMRCVTNGVPLPLQMWWRNGHSIETGGNCLITRERGINQMTSILTVSVNVENEYTIFGTYRCMAVNLHGQATYDITLLKADHHISSGTGRPIVGKK